MGLNITDDIQADWFVLTNRISWAGHYNPITTESQMKWD